MQDTSVQNFFAFMRERHAIYLRRFVEKAPPPWTDDPILREYSFTNVYRELDKTTVWFRENIRSQFHDPADILFATILFRWFNKIETGEAIRKRSLWLFSANQYERDTVESLVRPLPKWVTGAYIIKTPDNMDKLNGVLWCVDNVFKNIADFLDFSSDRSWLEYSLAFIQKFNNLQAAHTILKTLPYLGDFMAYEIVTDLRHTSLLNTAGDIMTWANPGPGAMRGVNRLTNVAVDKRLSKGHYVLCMRELLEKSQRDYWPNNEEYPPLEMRDIEHSLCEFDKYERARLGEGRPKQKFRSAQNFSLQV